jgi:hypothetical protein
MYQVALAVVAVAVFVFSWFFRFNDPGGSFAGLTDDHFFYLVRGWQILFGDLPVRDFVDHGAPLYYYVGAAVQYLFGRGTLSELLFSVSVTALGAALTYWLSARASGSVLLGLVGAAFHVLLGPRFYNYPKILAYAAAIPLLWSFADTLSARARNWLAVVTVVAFLFRHDHGVFIGVSMAVLLVLLTDVPVLERMKHAALYGVLCLALVAPYLAFIQMNGGVLAYFRQASAWAERDRDRAPVVWPGPFDNPDGVSDETKEATGVARAVGVLRDNSVAWMYYAEILLPVFALGVLAASRDGGRPGWPRAKAKIGMVAVLGLVLDVGFLRSPLAARLADPSVPLAILAAWLCLAVPRLLVVGKSLTPGAVRAAVLVRGVALAGFAVLLVVFGAGLSRDLYDRLDSAAMVDRVGRVTERAQGVARQVQQDWDLPSWADRPDRPDLINLSLYVNACTQPGDRVLVQAYMPQVLAMARRAFAGGHADLRPGFFATDEAQRLTLQRLRAQSVPIVLLDTETSLQNFRESFPIVTQYLDARYRLAGTHVFDGRFGVSLFVRRDLTPRGTWAPLAWPCYGSGRAGTT